MATLTQLRRQLDDLKAARATGARAIEFQGRRVEYKSDSEMAAAIAALEAEIDGKPRMKNFVVRSTKGW